MLTDVVKILAAAMAIVAVIANVAYAKRYRLKNKSVVRLTQASASLYALIVIILDFTHITSMQDVSGYLLLLALTFMLTASAAEGLVDL